MKVRQARRKGRTTSIPCNEEVTYDYGGFAGVTRERTEWAVKEDAKKC